MLRVFVYVLGLNAFVCFKCDVRRDVVWSVLRVFVVKSCCFFCLFLWCVVFACSWVFKVFVRFRCDLRCDAARCEFVCVCCLCVCVFVCLLLWFVYVCGGYVVLGDVVWCVFGFVFCCVCVCFYVCCF